MTDADFYPHEGNAWLVCRAFEDIQDALDIINLPLKEQERPYTIVGALEEIRALLRSAKVLLKETGCVSND